MTGARNGGSLGVWEHSVAKLDTAGDGGGRVLAVLVVALVVMVGAVYAAPVSGPVGLLVVVVGAVGGALLLGSPVLALALLLVTSFARLALNVEFLPAEPMVLVFCGLVVSALLAGSRAKLSFRLGALEAAMAGYLLWNVVSAVMPHDLPAVQPFTNESISLFRFILTGTALPFVAFVVARATFVGERRVRQLMVGLVSFAVYSAFVSVLQFTGPTSLVWPRYIVEDPTYPERAVGVMNQPVVNGLVMVAGFLTAMFMTHDRIAGARRRLVFLVAALACIPGVYMTKTRAVWLAFGVGVVLCAIFARGMRTGFVVTLVAMLLTIGANWATFTSPDRVSGGVGSSGEVDDRLNSIATSLWAIEREPVVGWGIGRFAQVNTEHHKQWEPSTDFRRGYGISSHENELGIATELGLVGLALWLAVVLLMVRRLVVALRVLPAEGLAGRVLGLLAVTVLGTWVVIGFTVDLRFLDFANLLTFTVVGAAVGAADAVSARAAARPAPPTFVGSRA